MWNEHANLKSIVDISDGSNLSNTNSIKYNTSSESTNDTHIIPIFTFDRINIDNIHLYMTEIRLKFSEENQRLHEEIYDLTHDLENICLSTPSTSTQSSTKLSAYQQSHNYDPSLSDSIILCERCGAEPANSKQRDADNNNNYNINIEMNPKKVLSSSLCQHCKEYYRRDRILNGRLPGTGINSLPSSTIQHTKQYDSIIPNANNNGSGNSSRRDSGRPPSSQSHSSTTNNINSNINTTTNNTTTTNNSANKVKQRIIEAKDELYLFDDIS